MTQTAHELILLDDGVDYSPTFVSTDKRAGRSGATSIGYHQIGVDQQYGFSRGPIAKIEFVDISAVTATHVKVWGLGNEDDDAPIYPKAYFTSATSNRNIIPVYLKKFIFCNSSGVEAAAGGAYTVIGHKLKTAPLTW